MDLRQQIESNLHLTGCTYDADVSLAKAWPKNAIFKKAFEPVLII